ncbi:hypothetical protein J2S11_003087 [Bacillus horti]|uniref:Uncharacterized protein n=1 Tax=Caldalkalibacillus horti TaxID=77523 RepID=A0ABT9W264_9BACI|nr:hypothetical protein [Bacillus horti]
MDASNKEQVRKTVYKLQQSCSSLDVLAYNVSPQADKAWESYQTREQEILVGDSY